MTAERIKMIEDKLKALSPDLIEIEDEGHLHVGHAGAKKGGHFRLTISSKKFIGLSMVDRHRLIFDTLGNLMETEIHALSIKASTP
ncbi:MAG: transcriptional regulator [Gammaproteobacteria bacterium]|nr:transcriptional regulator [Gammaproteobacteria bacterium]|tara:strand:+ start:490 stop:747 length:258 start_codon:yes stop_codon:yes gene_type:complete